MALIKRFVCFFYSLQALFFSVVCAYSLYLPISSDPRWVHRHAHATPASMAFAAVASALLAVVFGMAWHAVRRGKDSARYWVIFPSIFFLFAGGAGIYLRPTASIGAVLLLLAGIAGPVVVWQKRTRAIPTVQPTIPAVKGDGTSNLLNRFGVAFSFVSYFGSLMLWDHWLKSQGAIPMRHGIVVLLAVILVSVFFHELGHATIGLVFKMKLRAFVAGPFQWRIRDGQWTFQFNLAAILNMGGVTGVVPTTTTQPAWERIAMIAAGPLTNLYLGVMAGALAIAMVMHGGFAATYTNLLALFAIISLVDCFTNLIPLRSGAGYSDGAQIFQLLSNGPWGAYHRTMALVGSSLVTPLRPRDFDMETLDQAARGISTGMAGMLLRLFRYDHYLDCGRLQQAGEALKEAEAICRDSQLNVPAELQTVFVIGNAYVLRNAAAAQTWWDRMTAMKPTGSSVNFGLASCALHWIKGDLTRATEEWYPLHEQAGKLPAAGSYEFDRYLCQLLRRVLDGDQTPPPIVEPTFRTAAPASLEPAMAAAPVVDGTLSEHGHHWLYLEELRKREALHSGH